MSPEVQYVAILLVMVSTPVSRSIFQGFPDHPHRGQATVTYMLEG